MDGGSGWWPRGAKDGGGSGGCRWRDMRLVGDGHDPRSDAGSRMGEAGEEREGREQGGLASGARLIVARERVTDGADYNADGLN
jgi:hypothetical protein